METKKIYQCNMCKQVVEIVHNTTVPLICCGQKMEEKISQTKDSTTEKHVPFIEEKDNRIIVKIGQNDSHPMTQEHYIQFVEVITKDGIYHRKDLTPENEPQVEFNININDIEQVREFCNIHGLWKN